MKKIGVVLSGCGVYDGSEIHEAVITLLAIARNGAQAVCFAPDKPQRDVINHLTGEPLTEQRNVLSSADWSSLPELRRRNMQLEGVPFECCTACGAIRLLEPATDREVDEVMRLLGAVSPRSVSVRRAEPSPEFVVLFLPLMMWNVAMCRPPQALAPAMDWLGTYSLPLYCVHLTIIVWVSEWLGLGDLAKIAAIAAALVVSWGFSKLISFQSKPLQVKAKPAG